MSANRTVLTMCLLAAVMLLPACTTVDRSFPEQDPGQVWRALIAVAETPDYDDEDPARRWFVKENHVAVFEDEARIEIYREVQRVLYKTQVKPLHQRRDWRFRVLFDGAEPPTATFISRGFGVPAHAQDEAERFFDDVADFLTGERFVTEQEPIPTAAPPVDEADGGEPIVDIEDLEPAGR